MNPSLMMLALLSLLVLLPDPLADPSLLVTSDRMGRGNTMLSLPPLSLLLMLVTTVGILGVVVQPLPKLLRRLLPRMERALLVAAVLLRVAVSSSSILQILLRKHPPPPLPPPPGVAPPPLRREELSRTLLLLLWDGVVATVVGVAIDVMDAIALLPPLVVVGVLSVSSCLMGVNHCSWRMVAAVLLALVLLARGEYNEDCVDSLRVATLVAVVLLDVPLTLLHALAVVHVGAVVLHALLLAASPRRDRGETTVMVLWPRPFRPVFIPPILLFVRPGGGWMVVVLLLLPLLLLLLLPPNRILLLLLLLPLLDAAAPLLPRTMALLLHPLPMTPYP